MAFPFAKPSQSCHHIIVVIIAMLTTSEIALCKVMSRKLETDFRFLEIKMPEVKPTKVSVLALYALYLYYIILLMCRAMTISVRLRKYRMVIYILFNSNHTQKQIVYTICYCSGATICSIANRYIRDIGLSLSQTIIEWFN